MLPNDEAQDEHMNKVANRCCDLSLTTNLSVKLVLKLNRTELFFHIQGF